MIREPAVSGMFYESNLKFLRESIEESFKERLGVGYIPEISYVNPKKEVYSIMVPHAGYVYSLPIASHAFAKVVEDGYPETFVIICPNHTGFGEDISVFNEGAWLVPNGKCVVDDELSDLIISKSNYAKVDYFAHQREHSIEVQLPVLKYFNSDFEIVPICMMDQSVDASIDLANSIYEASQELNRNITVIDSTDLSHFRPQEITLDHDDLFLNEVIGGNIESLYETVKNNQISVCGYGPTMTTMEYSKKLGLNNFKLLKHATSGNVSLDYNSVVGYASGLWI